jgi:hypothetical protein
MTGFIIIVLAIAAFASQRGRKLLNRVTTLLTGLLLLLLAARLAG